MVSRITQRGIGNDDNDVITDDDNYDDDDEDVIIDDDDYDDQGVNGVLLDFGDSGSPRRMKWVVFIAISGAQPHSSENKNIYWGNDASGMGFQGQRSSE